MSWCLVSTPLALFIVYGTWQALKKLRWTYCLYLDQGFLKCYFSDGASPTHTPPTALLSITQFQKCLSCDLEEIQPQSSDGCKCPQFGDILFDSFFPFFFFNHWRETGFILGPPWKAGPFAEIPLCKWPTQDNSFTVWRSLGVMSANSDPRPREMKAAIWENNPKHVGKKVIVKHWGVWSWHRKAAEKSTLGLLDWTFKVRLV